MEGVSSLVKVQVAHIYLHDDTREIRGLTEHFVSQLPLMSTFLLYRKFKETDRNSPDTYLGPSTDRLGTKGLKLRIETQSVKKRTGSFRVPISRATKRSKHGDCPSCSLPTIFPLALTDCCQLPLSSKGRPAPTKTLSARIIRHNE